LSLFLVMPRLLT
ncbi:ferrous iron transport protein B, partial [Vibrio parahaemolyticus AQ3810]